MLFGIWFCDCRCWIGVEGFCMIGFGLMVFEFWGGLIVFDFWEMMLVFVMWIGIIVFGVCWFGFFGGRNWLLLGGEGDCLDCMYCCCEGREVSLLLVENWCWWVVLLFCGGLIFCLRGFGCVEGKVLLFWLLKWVGFGWGCICFLGGEMLGDGVWGVVVCIEDWGDIFIWWGIVVKVFVGCDCVGCCIGGGGWVGWVVCGGWVCCVGWVFGEGICLCRDGWLLNIGGCCRVGIVLVGGGVGGWIGIGEGVWIWMWFWDVGEGLWVLMGIEEFEGWGEVFWVLLICWEFIWLGMVLGGIWVGIFFGCIYCWG